MSRTGLQTRRRAHVEAASEHAHVVERLHERSRRRGADDEREDDEREHGERHAGAEEAAQGVRHRHPQHRRHALDPPARRREGSEQDVGVVHDRPGRPDDDHEPAEDEDREVHLHRAEQPAAERKHEPRHQCESCHRVHEAIGEAQQAQERNEAQDDEGNPEPEGHGVVGPYAAVGEEQPQHDSRDATATPPAVRRSGDSGRFLIAATMFIRLTRQAENATTASVSRMPSEHATARLAGLTEYPIDRSLVDENADAIASTIP